MIDKSLMALSETQGAAETAKEHLQIARDWAVMLGSVVLAAALLASLLSAAYVALAPLWVLAPLVIAAAGLVVIAFGVWRTLGFARYAIQSRLYQFEENQNTLREIAREIAKQQPQTVNVKGRQNVVSVNSQGQSAESVRLIGVSLNRPERFLDGVDERDLIYFCERVPLIGHTQRVWMGAELPSGRRITTFADYDKLLQPLCKAGLVADRRERSAGHLVTNDAGEIKRALGLPSGPQIETKDVTPAS